MADADDLFGQEHVERYEETDGEVGHEWHGTVTLILGTTGRRSGQLRKTPLIYGLKDGSPVIVASKGGADEPPAWFLNLEEHPEVHVQVQGDRFTAKARTASSQERRELWPMMAERWPPYDEYQQKTEREIPIVVLDRV